MATAKENQFKKQLKRSLATLDKNTLYPTDEFPEVGNYSGELFLGETLIDPIRSHSKADVAALFGTKSEAEWIAVLNQLVSKVASGGSTSRLVDFLNFNTHENIIKSYLTLDFLAGYEIKVIVCLQEVSKNELSTSQMRLYKKAMESVGIKLIHFPLTDHETPVTTYPDRHDIMGWFESSVITPILHALAEEKNVFIHCKGGQGRTGQIAGSAMMRMFQDSGSPLGAEDIISKVCDVRSRTFSKAIQKEFFHQYCKHVSGVSSGGGDAGNGIQELIRKGKEAEQSGQHSEAQKQFKAVLQKDDENPNALYALGKSMMDSGRNDEAIPYFKKAYLAERDSTHYVGGYVMILQHAGRYQESLPIIEEALAIDPHYTYGHTAKGYAHLILGNLDKAVASFKRSIELNDKDPYPYSVLGNALFQQKNYSEAFTAYDKGVKLNADDTYSLGGLAACYYHFEDFDNCYNFAVKAIEKGATDDSTKWYKDNTANKRGGDAKKTEFGADLHSCQQKAYDLLGAKKFQESIDACRAANNLKPTAYTYGLLGAAYGHLGKYELSYQNYKSALDLDENNAYGWTGLGYAYQVLGRYHEAINAYTKTLELEPNNEYARNNLAECRNHV